MLCDLVDERLHLQAWFIWNSSSLVSLLNTPTRLYLTNQNAGKKMVLGVGKANILFAMGWFVVKYCFSENYILLLRSTLITTVEETCI